MAVQKYLTARTAGRGLDFQVVVHDPSEPDMNARGMDMSLLWWYNNYQGAAVSAAVPAAAVPAAAVPAAVVPAAAVPVVAWAVVWVAAWAADIRPLKLWKSA